ncbi:hypothetical protein PAAG_08215 [Paracoccidioides lutzii Pb01]|uniref:Acyl-protein thioesterase 1 n=1 Tax=Paracoccidioides lutzii (strain ATCC MYA-826 / Pb01) TaxID=502779 RepID=C1HBS4_PARBA|nr:hypothetical protein PAAG_08215 [Paracoccidioides lutzii Pb01]EEH38488.2 hypothetical protein PAAG_08215 [Paracoccidioides lutzii Pb01]
MAQQQTTPSPTIPSPLPFPKPTTIPPRGPHTHTLILLHGRGDSSLDFSTEFITLPLPISPSTSKHPLSTLPQRFPGVKFVFPGAKMGLSTFSGNMMMPQWFDVVSLDPPYEKQYELQREGLRSSVNYLLKLVKEEAAIVGGVGKVVVGGLSQGAVVALAAAMSFDTVEAGEALGGCVAMNLEEDGENGWLRSTDPKVAVSAANWFRENVLGIPPINVVDWQQITLPKTHLWIAHGALDTHLKPQYGEEGAKTLEKLGWNVTFMLYDELEHWYMPDELEDMAIYLDVVVGVPEAE